MKLTDEYYLGFLSIFFFNLSGLNQRNLKTFFCLETFFFFLIKLLGAKSTLNMIQTPV